ncbi:MAG: acetyl-CoA carboxylase biotin carboxyl carrier protein [Bacteroidia bacterium]|nr:acetyl-CoA carboxylase biotin carboxyl carrier protein [Bacteroidia bacterium]MCO5253421.1 acetyl-CoA carboxylase biotin carboxyl carrier protein [Bacteroidota bacterium]MCZ2129877.1 acetyl-CoA carboxylase biotin carboxyl carrier protein [Bacteroidia bacterium]
MDLKDIQNLIKFVATQSVDEVEIEKKDFKITIKKNAPIQIAATQPQLIQASIPTPQIAQPAAIPAQTPAAPATPAKEPVATNLITVKSPMIGTFYRSSKPENPAFVSVGDEIKPGKVLCIIEAMKLFNEIESEVSGKIVKILVDNNSPVEYDQPLFLVEP